MQNEIYRLMVSAVACNLSCDQALEMLNQSYIDSFARSYEESLKSGDQLTVLDYLINFTMRELPLLTDASGSITFELSSRRDAIITTFIKSDLPTMMTQLASRKIFLEKIRGALRRENIIPAMVSKLMSTRVDEIFNQFIKCFHDHYASAFRFDGSFVDFVMFCFTSYFYRNRKTDIWKQIRAEDLTKREIEQNVVQEKIIEVNRTDDVPIHELLINISVVNDLMFMHSGQSVDSHGVQYDIYYLIMCALCERKVREINKALGEEVLEFVDPKDRKITRGDLEANKGIAAKITNAKELIMVIFNYVCAGNLNTASLSDLRDVCFQAGKHDRDGRNCVWLDVSVGGETNRYLDTPDAHRNYRVYDQLVKGVISVYTLMTELEARGRCLVDNYNMELFVNKEIIRYMDYLSSTEYLDLIKELQAEKVDYARYGSDLLEFEQMVDEYAGSAVNNHPNIRENRYYAITRGFLSKPRLKQSKVPVTKFDILKKVAACLDATPRGYREYLASTDKKTASELSLQTFANLRASDVVEGRYISLYYNQFLSEEPIKAEYYLKGLSTDSSSYPLDDLSWSLGSCNFEAVYFTKCYGIFVPLHNTYFLFGLTGNYRCLPATLEQLKTHKSQNIHDNVDFFIGPLNPVGILSGLEKKLNSSMGFSYEVGILNLAQSAVKNRIDRIGLTGVYKQYIDQYYSQLGTLANVQYSIIEVLKVIMAECIYLLEQEAADKSYSKQAAYAEKLFSGLLTGDFNQASLDWILDLIYERRATLKSTSLTATDIIYRPVDTTVLRYCFENKVPEMPSFLLDIVESTDNPSQRFLMIYNHVYTRLAFFRYLRDAFSLGISTVSDETPTLICEIIHKFNVRDKLNKFVDSDINYGAKTEKMSYDAVKHDILDVRMKCMASFKTLISELIDYTRDAEDEIAGLLEYNIASQDFVKSKFSNWGTAFTLLPSYQGVEELNDLRKRATTDSAGFFLLNGNYFKGINNNIEYYVHKSGYMVYESNGNFEAATFNFDKENDKRLYRNILGRGFEAFGL